MKTNKFQTEGRDAEVTLSEASTKRWLRGGAGQAAILKTFRAKAANKFCYLLRIYGAKRDNEFPLLRTVDLANDD